jgi:CBS domain-containing protein
MRRGKTVSEVMTSRVHVARPMTPFKRLVQLIEDNKISALPIVDAQGIPVGIVSESDLLLKERRRELDSESSLLHPRRRRQERAKAEGVVAWEIMTKPPITVRSDVTLAQAARLMQERNVRRLVVVDGRDKIVGIVSRSDLLQVFLGTDGELRDEVLSTIIPSMLLSDPESVQIAVRWNVVTLSGEVDRKSDAEIFARMTLELEGVVDVVNRLTYKWDDTGATPVGSMSLERSFRAI